MSTVKKALRGLADLRIFPVTSNTADSYAVGTGISVAGVQEFTSTKEVEDWKVYADDGIYDSGSTWQGNSFTLTLAGLPLELRADFEGGVYDEETGEYSYLSTTEAPEIALSFSSLSGSGQKELTKIYCAKCSRISFDHKTKGGSESVTPVKIEGTFMNRKTDNAIFAKKDAAAEDITWLEKIV